MVLHSCYTNLKGFAISRPPLVVFTLCLTALAIATLSLARVVSQNDSIPNPDVKLDWNMLLRRMADLELCILQDEINNKATTVINSTVVELNTDEESVTALLGIDHEIHNYIHNNTMITGSLSASLLGLKGNQKLSVSFRVDVNTSSAHLPSHVCATFTGPRGLLPDTQTPPSCNAQPAQSAASSGSSARLLARPQAPQMVDDWCEEGTILSLTYHNDPSLTVMLTLHDRSMVNLHLMHTSYFLLVMAMTLVCYALLRGKHNKNKTSGSNPTLEKVPLDP